MMRYSRQRDRIHRYVRESHAHPTAQMVYDALREESPNLSLGTVYRDLNQLAEAGELSRIAMPDGSCRFDGTLHGHSHIVCERCGAVEDVEVLADRFGGQIERQTGFRLSTLSLVMRGVCPVCRGDDAAGSAAGKPKRV